MERRRHWAAFVLALVVLLPALSLGACAPVVCVKLCKTWPRYDDVFFDEIFLGRLGPDGKGDRGDAS
jgi:hypothetical protein